MKDISTLSDLDVLAMMLAFSDVTEFPAEKRFIQDFIRKMRDKGPEFKELLPFAFSMGVDPYPFSRDLDEVITLLRLGGVIISIQTSSRETPVVYRISGELSKKFIIKSGELNGEDVKKIRNLAYEFTRAAEMEMR